MSGQTAICIGDKVVERKIIQDSATVLIGSAGGVACSVCPGDRVEDSAVNLALGAKVLVGESELDFALPGALPLVWQRRYSSYVNPRGSHCGLLGHGWYLPLETRIELDGEACRLFDENGRVITFAPLTSGEYDRCGSESLILMRGGPQMGPYPRLSPWQQQPRWFHIPRAWAGDARYFFTAGPNREVRVFLADAYRPGHYPLQCVIDPLGRQQFYQRNTQGQLEYVYDGIGRQFALLGTRIHDGLEETDWGFDTGLRLAGVDLLHDPLTLKRQRQPLVRYHYSPEGDLVGVSDRNGTLVREFAYHNHRLILHRDRGGPTHRYLYEHDGPGARVIEQLNKGGLSSYFHYDDANNAVKVLDSLERENHYSFEGGDGLKRLRCHTRADGSQIHYQYGHHGRKIAETDPLGCITRYHYDGLGRLKALRAPDGTSRRWCYDKGTGLLTSHTDATGCQILYRYD
ncbi:MAG: DUF6531 domain-containing protein, partial [Chromatiales bacterium]|nr:DUF6531 domain-containing protein [Chromatiales bacterium]